MVIEKKYLVQGEVGKLEVLIGIPVAPKGIAILCHPHPLFSGTMNNKVITTSQRFFLNKNFVTIRFNFRGVGESDGAHDNGNGEVRDILSVAEWIQSQFLDLPVTLLGFSFGACMAAKASFILSNDIALRQLILIAPPVKKFLIEMPELLNKIIIQPADDEVVNANDVYMFYNRNNINCDLIKVSNCSHFFHGNLVQLKKILEQNVIV